MAPYKLELEADPDSNDSLTIYRAKGKLSLETVNEFIQTLRPLTTAHLILDLGGVTFLDSAGVGSLVSIFINRRTHKRTFALTGLTAQSGAVVTVAGLQNLLPIFKTVDEAKAKQG